ncbi:MAG: hypothetical protein PHU64_06025 [Candidatus Omnitrophica bacterium]|nr:hypothetical protein [Candidatus Omnitrophota bacterium]MDD5430246.1 hypothetical protein [Candidatus Omnitrophota bacterium]
MKDSPLIISLLIGLIVVLVIAGVSVLAKMNSLSVVYKQQLAKNIGHEKTIEDLKTDNSALAKNISQLDAQMKTLQSEHEKLTKLKEKLEENLKEELMRKKLGE